MDSADRYIGQIFGERYTVINVIGSGENSVVFGAYDTVENRIVALKILRPEFNDDPLVAERFSTEVTLMSMLSHPNVVKIYDTCLEGDLRYFVMEYVAGITLKKHIIERGALPTEEIVFLSKQILSALEAIHAQGIVHSDIKPQNVVVIGNGHVCLVDFGISKLHKSERKIDADADDPTFGGLFSDDPISEESDSDLAVGTVHYVSPEQAQGREIDHLSDLYSTGIMMYEMATGILPFFAESAQQIAIMHVRQQPVPPSHVNPDVPEELENIILRAMEKLPIARFPSAREMREALETFEERDGEEMPPEPTESITLWQKVKSLATDYVRDFSVPSFIAGLLCALLVTVVFGLGILSEALISERNAPDHVKIPDVTGRSVIEVLNELDPQSYQFEITYTVDSGHPGRVLSQSPRGGSVEKLSEGKKAVVSLTVARYPLPPTMPELRGMELEDVMEILGVYNCEVTVTEQSHALIPKGSILSTFPAAGQPSQSKITLYVSAGWQSQENQSNE